MEELRTRQEELERLNQELQDTNRGVVALYAELDERADHLRRADELKSKFLSHMSHEFRTPLNSILALSRLLLSYSDGRLNGEQEKQVQFIYKAAEDLTELVNDLLDLAKVEAGRTTVAPSRFTVDSLFGALRGMLRPLLVGDAVALVFEETANLPALDTDEGKVSQILRNFISNAIKFTERGEVRVWASADAQADTVTFHVHDTGIGIAPEDIGLIFQEFGQVSHRLQGKVKGTGLGLPLARKLAELLGGRIGVESEPGRGSTFSVALPRVYRGDAGAEEPAPDIRIEPDRVPVLLVEDEPAHILIMERCLAGTRYQVLHAASIRAAETVLQQVEPAAILLDVVLANDESWRMMLRLREDSQRAHIPLVVVSSAGEPRKALHLGADEYLEKPVEREILIERLDRLTGQRSVIRVLLVDDEEVTQYLVRHLLPRSAYQLSIAGDGRAGLQYVNERQPDLILLDLNMPGMDGYEFLARLRAMPDGSGIPVVVLSAAAPPPGDPRLASAAAILSKSALSPAMLTEAVRNALRPAEPAVG
jgi:CheY-like chemotaxis protein/nitrogen-specific signal transduction histidine kinase